MVLNNHSWHLKEIFKDIFHGKNMQEWNANRDSEEKGGEQNVDQNQ